MAQSKKPVVLLFQAGGASGAFGAGVADSFLSRPDIKVIAAGGSSAGAMTSAAIASGMTLGGPGYARTALQKLWKEVRPSNNIRSLNGASVFNLVAAVGGALFGGRAREALMDLVRSKFESCIDFPALRENSAFPVFVGATDIETGLGRVFTNRDITADAVAASCSVPGVLPPVMIDGRAYRDGGFTVNPPLEEVVDALPDDTLDVAIVQTIPLAQSHDPAHPYSSVARLAQIMMNNGLLQWANHRGEINNIADALGPQKARELGLKKVFVHVINDPDHLVSHSLLTMMDFSDRNLADNWKLGRRFGQEWLEEFYDALGQRSTFAPALAPPVPAALNSFQTRRLQK